MTAEVTGSRAGRAGPRRCAVIVNPVKVSDRFRERMQQALDRGGWVDTLWLETRPDDSGRAMTRQAVTAGVDLVVAAGGDGTVRLVADGLAGTGIAMALVPAGTGNLLARNLGMVLQEAVAVEVALGGHTGHIDLIEVTVDDRPPEHFAVMAGIGFDAMVMDETDPALKARIGWLAYFLAAGKALRRAPVPVTVELDGDRPMHRHAMACVIGNVSSLEGNLTLIPGATATDGRLHLYVASPHRLTHWLRLALRLLTRRGVDGDRVDQLSGSTVSVTVDGTHSYQLDGDVIGEVTRLTARVRPDALTICVPARWPGSRARDGAAGGRPLVRSAARETRPVAVAR